MKYTKKTQNKGIEVKMSVKLCAWVCLCNPEVRNVRLLPCSSRNDETARSWSLEVAKICLRDYGWWVVDIYLMRMRFDLFALAHANAQMHSSVLWIAWCRRGWRECQGSIEQWKWVYASIRMLEERAAYQRIAWDVSTDYPCNSLSPTRTKVAPYFTQGGPSQQHMPCDSERLGFRTSCMW